THSRPDKDTTCIPQEKNIDKETTCITQKKNATCGEDLEEVTKIQRGTRLTEASGGSGGSAGLTGERVSAGKCLFGGGSEGDLGCDGGGRAVTIIFKEEEQCCIKPRNDNGGGSGGGRRHHGGVVTIMAMERNRAESGRGGKSGVVRSGEIHRNGFLGNVPERKVL
ncbi:hypothetical protein HID58_078065, partial [Brassica napus]